MYRVKALLTSALNTTEERISNPEIRTKKIHKHSADRLKSKEIKVKKMRNTNDKIKRAQIILSESYRGWRKEYMKI